MSLALASRRAAISPSWVRNALWRNARAVPSLDLQFADTKSLADAISGQNLITFTRASSATYVGSDGLIKTAATNEPRFDHNPTTGESLGLLVEEQRTNLLPWSEDISQWFAATNLTVTTNQTTAPGGASTAGRYLETAATGLHVQDGMGFAFVAGSVYTYSVFVKSINSRNFEIGFPGTAFSARFAKFNLVTGAVQGVDAGVVAQIQAFPDGWYRCQATATCTSGTSARIGNFINDASFSRVYAGNTASGIFIWGAQLEAGAFPTSYIPTTTATVTRSADVASITGTNFSSWYNQSEGTVFISSQTLTTTGNAFALQISDNSYNNRIVVGQDSSNSVGQAIVSGAVTLQPTANASRTSNVIRQAFGLTANSAQLSVNGTASTEDTSGAMTSGLTRLDAGSDHTGNNRLNGTIRRLTYWPQRLGNPTLQALTQ